MGNSRNAYLENNFTAIQRASILEVQIFSWIAGQKFMVPSISVDESAKSFLSYNNIDEGELSIANMRQIYYRLLNKIIDEQKTDKQN
ncbi:MAG: hypothetical protein BWY74_03279 [Firmicutes bacterium ADurb.Bin419]|nr:MAG: hypothetical protein BWY74_03279 [Firmicutes bacterium ADurb.Bin419]